MDFWHYGNRVRDQFAVDANGEALPLHSQGAYLLTERALLGLGDAGRDVTAFAATASPMDTPGR